MSIVVFEADMHCSGCSNAITRILTKVPGVEGVDCVVETNTVTVQLTSENPPEVSLLESKLNTWAEAANKPPVIIK